MKVTYPIYEEVELNLVVEEIKKLGKVCAEVKRYYPSAWHAMKQQFLPEYSSDKKISELLLDKKLEVMLLQDEENRMK